MRAARPRRHGRRRRVRDAEGRRRHAVRPAPPPAPPAPVGRRSSGLTVPGDDAELREIAAKAIAAAADDGTAVGRLRITVTGGPGPLGSGRDAGARHVVVAAGPGDAWPPTTDVVDRAVAPQRAQRGRRRQDDLLRRERRRPRPGPRARRRPRPSSPTPPASCARAPAPTCSSWSDGRLLHAAAGHRLPRRHHPRAGARSRRRRRARRPHARRPAAAPTRRSSRRRPATSSRSRTSTAWRCPPPPARSRRRPSRASAPPRPRSLDP